MNANSNIEEGRFGGWISTYSGGMIFPLDPRPEEIILEDICHALSLVTRWAGHCKRHYSVGQHSLLVARQIQKNQEYEYDELYQLYGLMHDFSEYALCDIPRPMKPFFIDYIKHESRLMEVIYESFGIPLPTESHKLVVHEADEVLLHSEAFALCNNYSWADKKLKDKSIKFEVLKQGYVKFSLEEDFRYLVKKCKEKGLF